VFALMPHMRKRGSNSGNRAAGNPFRFHCETVLGFTPMARANANVPPLWSMISAAVLSGVMGRACNANGAIVKSAKNEIVPVVPISRRCG
jgi:hypothetical protein